MIIHPDAKPKVRPLEPVPAGEMGMIGLRDPTGISSVVLTLSEPACFILILLDGEHTLSDVRGEFLRRYGQPLAFETLSELIARLEQSLFLDGPAFESHYQRLLEAYRSAPAREVHEPAALGLGDGPETVFGTALDEASPDPGEGRIVGLIVPHLDYARGLPCYGSAYATLATQGPPARFVVLGTNHFGVGNSGTVVATGQDFATPLGTTRTDQPFLEKLEQGCGELRRFEYDHAGEHSVELQVCWLQHLFGAAEFTIVPLLCSDPCGPTGTAPRNGQGVDLAEFARVLGQTIADDDQPTIVIAGADFSHVGMFFGDQRKVDEAFLAEVRARDQAILLQIEAGDAAAFRDCVARHQNPTRVCSAGCVFTLLTALAGARGTVLRYHQAVTASVQNCVTCAAVVFRD